MSSVLRGTKTKLPNLKILQRVRDIREPSFVGTVQSINLAAGTAMVRVLDRDGNAQMGQGQLNRRQLKFLRRDLGFKRKHAYQPPLKKEDVSPEVYRLSVKLGLTIEQVLEAMA